MFVTKTGATETSWKQFGEVYQTPQSFGQSGEKEICHLEGDRHVPSPPSHQLLPYPVTPATSSCWEAGYRLPRFCCPSARRFLGVYSPHDSRSTCQKVSFPSSLSSYTSSAFHWCKHTFFFFFFCLSCSKCSVICTLRIVWINSH